MENDGASTSNGSQPIVTAVSLKLPPFWTADPELWFARAESQFNTRQPPVTSDRTRFDYVVAALDNTTCREVAAVIRAPPLDRAYDAIKASLIEAFGLTQSERNACLLYTSPSPRDRG